MRLMSLDSHQLILEYDEVWILNTGCTCSDLFYAFFQPLKTEKTNYLLVQKNTLTDKKFGFDKNGNS